ncbi:MAG: two-component regulator propeller domain-containing protein [Chitinophagaceae bacterium]
MKCSVLYIALFISVNLLAQSPVLYFRNLTTGNGLSHNKVNCILQDQRGFLWMGTNDGLNRYDGNQFQVFRHEPSDTSTISGNIITDLLEDTKGVLWIATADGGLSRYDFKLAPEKQFHQYKHSVSDTNSIPGNIINALVEDTQGKLWLATSGNGILRFDKASEKFSEPVWRKSRTCLDLCSDAKGIIWAGGQGGGLIKIDPVSLRFEEDIRYRDVYAKLPHMTVAALFNDSHNNIWMGSWDKVVYQISAVSQKEEVFKQSTKSFSFSLDDPLSFAEDNRKFIWIGGKYNGLHLFDPLTKNFFNYRHDAAREGTLADNQVNCVFIDRSGIVWIGTNRGISINDPTQQQFVQTFLPSSSSNQILYDFITDELGRLMIGCTNGLYVRQKDESFQYQPLLYKGEKLSATKFYKDGSDLYVGTNISLFRFANDKRKIELLPNTEEDVVMKRIIESRVVSMVKDTIDGHSVLLVSPYGHYFTYYDFSEQKWVNRQDSIRRIIKSFNIKDNLIRKFFKSKTGTIWVATAKAGLGEWLKAPSPQLKYYTNIPGDQTSIGNNNIYDIAEDTNANLWVSTYGGGLYYFNIVTKHFQHIAASHNLAEGIQVDKKGNIWMIANGNLHKYDPYRKSYTSFQLPDVEKTGGVRGSIFKEEGSGKMYVTGTDYFIIFHPDSLIDRSAPPGVFFTDFSIFNNSKSDLLYGSPISLEHNENFFSVEYAAPSYQEGYPPQYAHMLEGFEKNWVEDNGKAYYTNLDGGEYIFKVRATVKPGVWSKEIASLRIFITPPFWKRWWFYVLFAAIIGLIVYIVYRYRINELLKRQSIRNKIAQDLHDNVGSTLSSISVYSQVAKIYQYQGKNEALEDTLEKISGTSSEMISEMNDIVWAINPRNDNMETILQRMESFARPLLASQEIQFYFEYDASVKQMNLEMTKRKNFYLIFKEAVNNVLKYAACSQLFVTIRYQHHLLELSIRDDGKGFDRISTKSTHSLAGNGLQNMERRALEMKGTISIRSELGIGTTILLRFPLP